jgi:predicted secreted protein
MASEYGRAVAFTWDTSPVLGVREKSLTVNGEPVNVTSDEDDGVQVLLAEDAETSVQIELSGVTKDTVFRAAKLTGGESLQADVSLTYSDGGEIAGTFQLGPYSEGQPYNEAVTFTATLMSTGPVTYTPGTP